MNTIPGISSDFLSESIQNGERIVTVNWVEFVGTKLVTSAISRVMKFLRWEKIYSHFHIDEDRNIHQFSGNFFILEYQNSQIRENDKKLFQQHFKPTKHFATMEADGSQVPDTDFTVDYEGKYYLLIHARLRLTDITDVLKWVYRGVVVNPETYFKIPSLVQETKKKLKKAL